ncbi:MAG: orotidine-5'-phosphate decarboxylase [Atopobiaceae bacterium]|jgi:orotidine-5'-phosphate decarboxylase|nr:orotidine-5'-phosphate decarboxylase [Atopobiaceae bacterium]MCI2173271.1 orotidine-5'-phosphate decarboxylase [Atopobiaceae bacterium]MCI2207266.1 orotidine-5'-phosphate decarboxylase [Atopobiaceae bacterium]
MLEIAKPSERVIVALDCDHDRALELADSLSGHAKWMKVGMTLFYACGPSVVSELKDRGYDVFLDLKLHDIPHQVRGAARSASLTGADLLSVHSLGGAEMIAAAREGVEEAARDRDERTKLVAITVLTSMDADSLAQVGIERNVSEEVSQLAAMAYDSGSDGVVCSPKEASAMRLVLDDEALVVTPGVRPAGSALGDQRRVATPSDAVRSGASHIVVGRPITGASNPVAAFDAIAAELSS